MMRLSSAINQTFRAQASEVYDVYDVTNHAQPLAYWLRQPLLTDLAMMFLIMHVFSLFFLAENCRGGSDSNLTIFLALYVHY
jgi:hypothetical protein